MSRKDANKPKGRTTAYAYFVMSEKEQYAKVRPNKKKCSGKSVRVKVFGQKCSGKIVRVERNS